MNGWAALGILLLSLCLFGCAGPSSGSASGAGVSEEDLSVDEMNVVSDDEGFTMPSDPVYSEELGISSSDLSIDNMELDTAEDTFALPEEPV